MLVLKSYLCTAMTETLASNNALEKLSSTIKHRHKPKYEIKQLSNKQCPMKHRCLVF